MMDEVKRVQIVNQNFQFIAHRGLSGLAPENTKEAFKLAGEMGYYGIECDVHVTKDRQFIVFHDYTLERMTKKSGFIKDYTAEELSQINITSGNNIKNYEDVKIPLLTEYLDICKKYKSVPIIEVKNVSDLRDLDLLVDLLKEKELYDVANVISFQLNYLIYLRNRNPHLAIQYLVDEIKSNDVDICVTYHFNIDANAKKTKKQHIEMCHKHNILVNVYTVDNENQARKLNEAGIDFITTNILYDK